MSRKLFLAFIWICGHKTGRVLVMHPAFWLLRQGQRLNRAWTRFKQV